MQVPVEHGLLMEKLLDLPHNRDAKFWLLTFVKLCRQVEVPVEHGLLMENLLDLAHAPFTHTSTFAKGWPIPEVVRLLFLLRA